MAVPKRTRYEVLRRDGFACRCCGAKAPDVELHVDHVTPVALGGNDDPTNLVAACADCNAGKSSTSPNDAVIADVDAKAAAWLAARHQALAAFRVKRKEVARAQNAVLEAWRRWDPDATYLATNFMSTIEGWLRQGLTAEDVLDAYYIATGANIATASVWRYTCGVARNKIAEIDRMTQQILDAGDDI